MRGGDDGRGLQRVDRDLLLRAGHPAKDREDIRASHLTDHARAHEDDGNGLVVGNIERVEALGDGFRRLLPAVAAERVTDERVEGLALPVLADHVAELLRAGVSQLGPVAGRNGSRKSGVVEALGVHREGDVLVRCLEHVTASGVHDHCFLLSRCCLTALSHHGLISYYPNILELWCQAQQKISISGVFRGLTIWIKKFSFPRMQNRQFVFAPKIQYKLVAERSEANLQNLQFPQWCPREESNPHYEIRNLVSCPLNDKGGI